MQEDASRPRSITLDDLVTSASRAAMKTFKEMDPDLKIPPRIWVGIRIDPGDVFKEIGTDVGNP